MNTFVIKLLMHSLSWCTFLMQYLMFHNHISCVNIIFVCLGTTTLWFWTCLSLPQSSRRNIMLVLITGSRKQLQAALSTLFTSTVRWIVQACSVSLLPMMPSIIFSNCCWSMSLRLEESKRAKEDSQGWWGSHLLFGSSCLDGLYCYLFCDYLFFCEGEIAKLIVCHVSRRGVSGARSTLRTEVHLHLQLEYCMYIVVLILQTICDENINPLCTFK